MEEDTKEGFPCPDCGENSIYPFEAWWWKIGIIHFACNPGLCINELLLGQRIPKNLHLCKTCNAPFNKEKQYVKCVHCNTMINSYILCGKFGLARHFGVFCPSCEKPLPVYINIFTWLFYALTYPIWYFPWSKLKHKYFESQKKKMQTNKIELEKIKSNRLTLEK